jgi:hypothetical protein
MVVLVAIVDNQNKQIFSKVDENIFVDRTLQTTYTPRLILQP